MSRIYQIRDRTDSISFYRRCRIGWGWKIFHWAPVPQRRAICWNSNTGNWSRLGKASDRSVLVSSTEYKKRGNRINSNNPNQGLNIDLEGSDAHSLQETTFQWPDSGYFFTGYVIGYDIHNIQLCEIDSIHTRLEVFHSLHCLVCIPPKRGTRIYHCGQPPDFNLLFKNRLRQALYPDYYDVISNPDDPSRETHIGSSLWEWT